MHSCRRCSDSASSSCNRAVAAATTLPGIAIVPPLQRQRFQELQSCRRCSDSASSNCSRAAAAATAPPEWYACSRNTQFSRKKAINATHEPSPESPNLHRCQKCAKTYAKKRRIRLRNPPIPQTPIFVAAGERSQKLVVGAHVRFAKFRTAFKACTRVREIRPLCSVSPCKGPTRRPKKLTPN